MSRTIIVPLHAPRAMVIPTKLARSFVVAGDFEPPFGNTGSYRITELFEVRITEAGERRLVSQ